MALVLTEMRSDLDSYIGDFSSCTIKPRIGILDTEDDSCRYIHQQSESGAREENEQDEICASCES